MRRLVYLAATRRDLLTIFETVTEISGNLQTGRRYAERIRGHCRKLAALPGTIGRPRPELPHSIRSSACGSHVVYFRYVGETVEIVSILHARRDVSTVLGQGEEA